MRINYTLLAEELNDILLTTYSHYVHLLGRDDEKGETTHEGLYDLQESILKELSKKHLIMKNEINSNTNSSTSRYLDSVAFKLRKLGKV